MRLLLPALCALLILGCGKPAADTRGGTSQFAEASLVAGTASTPSYINCTVGLIPAYKYTDSGEVSVWIFPRSSGQMLTMDCDLSSADLKGVQVPVLSKSFTAEGALLNFQAGWPGGGPGAIVALEIQRKGRRIARVYGIVQ